MRSRGFSREEQIEHVDTQLHRIGVALAEARAHQELALVADLEKRFDDMCDWRNRLIPPPRTPAE